MRVISRRALQEFAATHPRAKPSLEQWYRVVRSASWRSLAEVKLIYPHADQVGRRTVFNIAGNNYRLIARINYRIQAVYLLRILTHDEYSKGEW